MPTYEYKCDACGHEWEVEQHVNDRPKRKCPNPKCGRLKARRLISRTAFTLKGEGWAKDGYR